MTGTQSKKALFLKACRGEAVDRVPVWMMRQAGRYLPEYRAVRDKHSFLEVCKTPDLAVEVSLQPFRILGVDAVIVFSDILIPAEAMGLPLELTDTGPRLPRPVRQAADVRALADFDPNRETRFLMDALSALRRELGSDVPLLGFAAAPWTLACYMVDGQTKSGFAATKRMMYSEPQLFRELLERIARTTARYLAAQVAAGATAVQLFDTWAGELDRRGYEQFALPATQRVIEQLDDIEAPIILYTKGTQHVMDLVGKAGADVLSCDWRVDLADVRRTLGPRTVVQGNVDPCLLLGPQDAIRDAVHDAIGKTGGIGHILNLGHGILPETPVENARAFIECGQACPVPAHAPAARMS